MTKTPTLRVSADMLVSQSRAPPPGPPLWVAEREVPSRLCPALTLAKPRILGGSGPDLSPVPKNRKHGCRPWWPLPSQWGSSGSVRGVREIWGPPRPPPPPYPQEAERGVNSRLRPALTLDEPRIGGGQDPTWRRGLPHGGTRAQALHSSASRREARALIEGCVVSKTPTGAL